MLYYVAFLWNDQSANDRALAATLIQRLSENTVAWTTAFNSGGLAVCCSQVPGPSANDVLFLPGERGVILGRLFSRRTVEQGQACTTTTLDEASANAIVSSSGQYLADKFWGRYLAFIRDPRRRLQWILRDPTGAIPCYRSTIGHVTVYFMRLDDFLSLKPPKPSLDHHYLTARMTYRVLSTRKTGLNEVTMLLGGERVEHNGDKSYSSFFWSPLEIASRAPIESFSGAVHSMRSVVRACTQSWASSFNGVLVFLSGGLDSSIILGSIAELRSKIPIVCVNNFSVGSNSDERHFAHLSAQKAGCRLIESPRNTVIDLTGIANLPLSPSPFRWSGDSVTAKIESQIAKEYGADAAFMGDGGDELFHRASRFPASVDYAYQHGLRPSLFSIALDDTSLTLMSFFEVLKIAFKRGLRRKRWTYRELYSGSFTSLLGHRCKMDAESYLDFVHPLYHSVPDLPPGKIWQAYHLSLYGTRGFNPCAFDEYPAILLPLLSQPIIELSLRIPCYVLMNGGRDRAVARTAFSQDIPPQIALRKTKGGVIDYVRNILERNRAFIRDYLLDGYLVQHGYLNRDVLLSAFSNNPSVIKAYDAHLLDCIDVEAWARCWAR